MVKKYINFSDSVTSKMTTQNMLTIKELDVHCIFTVRQIFVSTPLKVPYNFPYQAFNYSGLTVLDS